MATKKPAKKAQKASAGKSVKKAPARKPAVVSKPAKKSAAKPAAKKPAQKAAAKTTKPSAKKAVAQTKKAAAPVKKKAVKEVIKKSSAKPVAAKAATGKPAVKAAAVKKEAAKPVAKATPPATKPVKPVAQPLPKGKTVTREKAESKTEVQAVKPAPATSTPTKKPMSNVQSNEKSRYSDTELKEFKELLIRKLDDARAELVNLQAQIINANENGTDDTGATFKMLEDGSDTLAKEEAAQLAARQKKFIEQLEAALVRIENKTYGICRVTGKLIPKERLRAVPHTTQSMEAKLQQYRD